MYKKLKSLLADDLVFTSLLLCCVAVTAFILGRASALPTTLGGQEQSESTVRQTALLPVPVPGLGGSSTPPIVTAPAAAAVETGPIVASKSGTKYHLVTCPGAKQIKEENKIYFTTTAEAEASGYTAASNCAF
ncbi:MAG: hypothetical protein MUF19_04105 [Candidatus Pacebacteria bacterium]|jgi:hypothetical protein|nr:hypothetical protein [Candidatus Paceibacterota bacterium]